MASSSSGRRKNVLLEATCVQMAKAATAAAVNGATRLARSLDRSCMLPVVFSDRNVAPCSRQISTRVTPVSTAYGWNRSQNDPVKFWAELMGRPCSRSPSAMPISSGASRLPTVSATSQVRRQRAASRLPRYSKATPRMISDMSSRTIARYKPENMVAYQPGNAANMLAPATISQTSLPSHSGPIVLMAARRSMSSRPTKLCSMPTPKSKPSRTKKPVHKTAMTMNQNGIRVPIATSILDGRDRGIHVGLGSWRREFLARVLEHEQEIDRAERAVEGDERQDADPQPGGADGRRDAVLGQHDSLHDPRLAAALGQQPARGVHQERQHHSPHGHPQEHPGRREFPAPDQ